MSRSNTNQKDILLSGETKYRVGKNSRCSEILKKYKLTKFIDCGWEGCVYQACTQDKKCYVVKIIPNLKQGINNPDIKMSILMGNKDIGPKVIEVFECDAEILLNKGWTKTKIVLIIMEELEMSIKIYKEKYPNEYNNTKNTIISKITELEQNMTELGWKHPDLHEDNILINIDSNNNVVKLRFIDFSRLQKIK